MAADTSVRFGAAVAIIQHNSGVWILRDRCCGRAPPAVRGRPSHGRPHTCLDLRLATATCAASSPQCFFFLSLSLALILFYL